MLLIKLMNKANSNTWDSKLFRRILGISKPHITLLIYGIVLTILLAFLSPLRPYIIGKLVGEYVRLSDEKSLLYGALLVVGILIIVSIMLIAVSYLSSDLVQLVVKDLRDQLLNHITNLTFK